MTEDEMDRFIAHMEKMIKKEEEKLFSPVVIKEAREPFRMGAMEDFDRHASIKGPCGDTMEFFIRVEEGKIADLRFMTDGCGSSIACGSMAARLAHGKELDMVLDMTDDDILQGLGGLPEENRHCAMLAACTIRKAILLFIEGEVSDPHKDKRTVNK